MAEMTEAEPRASLEELPSEQVPLRLQCDLQRGHKMANKHPSQLPPLLHFDGALR